MQLFAHISKQSYFSWNHYCNINNSKIRFCGPVQLVRNSAQKINLRCVLYCGKIRRKRCNDNPFCSPEILPLTKNLSLVLNGMNNFFRRPTPSWMVGFLDNYSTLSCAFNRLYSEDFYRSSIYKSLIIGVC